MGKAQRVNIEATVTYAAIRNRGEKDVGNAAGIYNIKSTLMKDATTSCFATPVQQRHTAIIFHRLLARLSRIYFAPRHA